LPDKNARRLTKKAMLLMADDELSEVDPATKLYTSQFLEEKRTDNRQRRSA